MRLFVIIAFATIFAQAAEHPLAKAVCGACHLYPEPELLDRATWVNETLPRMKIRLGLSPKDLEEHPEAALLKESGGFPTAPLITPEEWESIVEFYKSSAPEKPLPQKSRAPIKMGMPGFTAEFPRFREALPFTTMVKINAQERRLYFGDAEARVLRMLDSNLRSLQRSPAGNAPASLHETCSNGWVTMIGSFTPTEAALGALVRSRKENGLLVQPKSILRNLPRVTHAEFGDLNGDGREDFALSIFGSTTGRFSWFEQAEDGEFIEHELWAKPGAIRSEIRDFNGDGRPDIAVLMAQETETLVIWINQGKGEFHSVDVFRSPASHGHTYFETLDFNRDGKLDFLVTNGDNGEYPSPLKNYHGIRIYLGRGNLQWKEAWFYPLNGAYSARARDFDLDGDIDIAACSFFPDYVANPRESFVYLENSGGTNFDFQPRTFSQCIAGRWLTMDAGDVDGDGDEDIVLGNYMIGPSPAPTFLIDAWQTNGPPIALLRNNARRGTNALPIPRFDDIPGR